MYERNYLIKDVIEKPSIANAPSNKAVIGRYILPKKIFVYDTNKITVYIAYESIMLYELHIVFCIPRFFVVCM